MKAATGEILHDANSEALMCVPSESSGIPAMRFVSYAGDVMQRVSVNESMRGAGQVGLSQENGLRR